MQNWARSSWLSVNTSQETSIFDEKNDVRMPFRYGTVAASSLYCLSIFAHAEFVLAARAWLGGSESRRSISLLADLTLTLP